MATFCRRLKIEFHLDSIVSLGIKYLTNSKEWCLRSVLKVQLDFFGAFFGSCLIVRENQSDRLMVVANNTAAEELFCYT